MAKWILLLAIPVAALLVLGACSGTPTVETGEPQQLRINKVESASMPAPGDVLRVASLNIAHGRGDSLNQLLVSKDSIRKNLGFIANFLREQEIHLAALQEVDAPSGWSGNFDHAEYLAVDAGYRWWIQASHASLGIANYGTAILSSVPIELAARLDFTPSPPTAGKGFTVAEILWQPPGHAAVTIDVVSIHMDFSRKSVREQQLQELSDTLKGRSNPLILMGDFNSETLADRLVREAAENERQLHTWIHGDNSLNSYKEKRLDWIIVSGDLEFVDYTAATAVLSDHRAVIAKLRLRTD